jgi:hypothetical protein
MAAEILSVPEEHLEEVVRVIRCGLAGHSASAPVRDALNDWCDSTERHLGHQTTNVNIGHIGHVYGGTVLAIGSNEREGDS